MTTKTITNSDTRVEMSIDGDYIERVVVDLDAGRELERVGRICGGRRTAQRLFDEGVHHARIELRAGRRPRQSFFVGGRA